MAKSLTIEREIKAPVGRVWRALTAINELKQWLSFFPDFKAEVGFKTEFDLGPDAEHQYHHHVEVLEVIEGRKLIYTWDYGGMSTGSSVTFELFEEGETTRLVLTVQIDHIPHDQIDFLKNATSGWNYTADSLKQFVESN
ncbi:MAG TPA: SRPBCC domain-containing protein [Candidatus Saccharimonadales bacterium]|jgi:uncharacterized protein YndB with AHSA1/START domain|nr:SRPBCC domain-containing protein [Candidatus Saccharimonadales bacterium]